MGSSETDVNELAVMPWILPGSRSTVTTVTPVEKWPRALRNSRDESGGGGVFVGFLDYILGGGGREGGGRGVDCGGRGGVGGEVQMVGRVVGVGIRVIR